jgi:hypothetical protein
LLWTGPKTKTLNKNIPETTFMFLKVTPPQVGTYFGGRPSYSTRALSYTLN